MTRAKLDLECVDKLLLAGNATFTVVSKLTKTRFTFNFRAVKGKEGFFFVRVLQGHKFVYVGVIDHGRFRLTAKSQVVKGSMIFRAVDWLVNKLNLRNLPEDQVEIWHEGKCCKCGKSFTVPESIRIGLGPECLKKTF